MRLRVMVFDPATGTMKPAWGENQPWGPVKAAGGSVHGEIVRGESGQTKNKADAAREREARKAA